MCTLSWIGSSDSRHYEVHFNRDEKHARLPARAPEYLVRSGVRFIAPRDGDAGGSWIAVNELGVTLCLLNRYQETHDNPERDYISRGQLVLRAAAAIGAGQVAEFLRQESLQDYRPFDLLVFSLSESPRGFSWNTERLVSCVLCDQDRPLSSSSRDHPGVKRVRRDLFVQAAQEGELDSEGLRRLHASHEPERGVYSFCMHREEARTVSYSRIRVDPSRAAFVYADGAPCETALAPELVLDLRRGG